MRAGKLRDRVVGNFGQQVPERRIRQLRLRLDRPVDKDPVRPIGSRLQTGVPERGLPDPHLALEDQRDRTRLDPAEEFSDACQRLLATDDHLQEES